MVEQKSIGSRAQVMHGNARKTSGGLTKKQLKYNKQGKIVSRKASALARKNNRLVKAGYVTKKGVFGSGKMKGGLLSREQFKKLYVSPNVPPNESPNESYENESSDNESSENKQLKCKEELEHICQIYSNYDDTRIFDIKDKLFDYIAGPGCSPDILITIHIHNDLPIEINLLQVFIDPGIFINLSYHSRCKIIEFLLGCGAKINDVNNDGMNALDYAYHVHDNPHETLKYPKTDHEEMIKFLKGMDAELSS
jgi:hypothetical protein